MTWTELPVLFNFRESSWSTIHNTSAKYSKSEFKFTLGRVTGLDAAGPLFEKTTKEVRIDKSDATYVDLIHTNGGNEDQG